jgi:hypothetical protein
MHAARRGFADTLPTATAACVRAGVAPCAAGGAGRCFSSQRVHLRAAVAAARTLCCPYHLCPVHSAGRLLAIPVSRKRSIDRRVAPRTTRVALSDGRVHLFLRSWGLGGIAAASSRAVTSPPLVRRQDGERAEGAPHLLQGREVPQAHRPQGDAGEATRRVRRRFAWWRCTLQPVRPDGNGAAARNGVGGAAVSRR